MIPPGMLLQIQGAVGAAGLVILWLIEGWQPFYAFYASSASRKHRVRHAARNLSLGLVNMLLLSLLLNGLTAAVLAWGQRAHFGLLYRLHAPVGWKTLLALLLIDGWMYGWHRANHHIPFLWRFHRVHHSDPNMDVTSAFRFHVGEILFSSLLRLALFPLLGIALWQALLYETILLPVIQFHHSNAALPERWDRLLRCLLVTPNMHRVHHSRWQPETDSNYSSIFSFWDRLAHTFRQVRDTRTLDLGLEEWDDEKWQSVPGLLRTPFESGKTGRRQDTRPQSEVVDPRRSHRP